MRKRNQQGTPVRQDRPSADYEAILSEVVELLEAARQAAARAVNVVITATYWEVGRRIVEFEQSGEDRAAYGAGLIERLSLDLKQRYGRGFGVVNLHQMRKFYLMWRDRRYFRHCLKYLDVPLNRRPFPEA